MAHKKVNLPHKHGYPGPGYYYVICDVCGKKMRAKDSVLIRDKYNTLNNMLVCKDDADETNPQTYIKSRKERTIRNPRYIRSEGTDQRIFIDTPSQIEDGDTSDPSGRVPSAPRFPSLIELSSSQIELQWLGPLDSGSSAIRGYKIERESPVGGGFSTLVADTASSAQYYKDTSVSASTQYNYRISAINRDGTSTASEEFAVTTEA